MVERTTVIITALRAVFLVVGIAWIALFPAISVSTGEFKVRSTFFDETTMAPLAAKTDFIVSNISRTENSCWEQRIYRPRASALDAIALIGINTNLAAAFAQYLGQTSWLAKNIILVEVNSSSCLKHWLDAYMGINMLPERAGLIRAGLILTTSPRGDNTVSANIIGANAITPNLDYLHLCLTALRGIVGIQVCCRSQCHDLTKGDSYRDRARGILYWTCAAVSGPNGAHAHLLNRGIQAISLNLPQNRYTTTDFTQRLSLGLELIVRSLNTLEHAFHHSFFFYWLPSLKHFISIDEFAWPLILLLSALYALTPLLSLLDIRDDLDSFLSTVFIAVVPFLFFGFLLSHQNNTQIVTSLTVYASYPLAFLSFLLLKSFLPYKTQYAHPVLLLASGFTLAPLVLGNPSLAFLGLFFTFPWLLFPQNLFYTTRLAWLLLFVFWPAYFPIKAIRDQHFLYADWKYIIILRFAFPLHASTGAFLFLHRHS